MSIKSEPYYKKMMDTNLFSPKNEYDVSNPKVTEVIDSITKFLSNDTSGFSNTILSRTLGGNTKLTQLGTIELFKAMTKRVASHLRQNELPTLSFEGLNLKLNKPLRYWKITPDKGIEGSISSLLENIMGYTPTINPVPSIESMSGDSYKEKLDNHYKWLKENTGEGTLEEYRRQVLSNDYSDEKNVIYGEGEFSRINVYNNGLKGETDKIKFDDTLEEKPIDFRGKEFPNYYPTSSIDGFDNDSMLIGKLGDKMSPYASAYKVMKEDGSIKMISKGSGVYKDNNSDEFIRTFNILNQYDSIRKVLKYTQPTKDRSNSTLKTVFPTVVPEKEEDYKNLMFSITNLSLREYASVNNDNNLSNKNPLDTMWFVPYGLTLQENVSVGWDKVDILGRNEPIYTYSGTERKCNINFILIADYPEELNNIKKWENATNNDFNKFYRQDNDFSSTIKKDKEKSDIEEIEKGKKSVITEVDFGNNSFTNNSSLKHYFDNNSFELKSEFINDDNLQTGHKGTLNFNSKINDLIDFVNSDYGKYYKIIIQGNSSSLYKSKYNVNLSYKRARAVYDSIITNITDKGINQLTEFKDGLNSTNKIPKSALINDRFTIKPLGEENSINTIEVNIAMVDRYVSIYLELDVSRAKTSNNEFKDDTNKNISPTIDNALVTDDNSYFMKNPDLDMVIGDEFNDNSLNDKLLKTYASNIKYFRPVYHSQTPVDLNKRVTFLQQCTRQGNFFNSIESASNTGNSIFGKPPVCILRLGDYLHTKILIENIDFNYEPLIWDSNPEGIGMQPMMCTVNMNCIILGGSSLAQPVNDLQNALATNFYANAELYNKK